MYACTTGGPVFRKNIVFPGFEGKQRCMACCIMQIVQILLTIHNSRNQNLAYGMNYVHSRAVDLALQ